MREKEWRGIPREKISWHPTIDHDKCIACKICINYCKCDVLKFDTDAGHSRVVNPINCTLTCRSCAKLCRGEAISLPDEAVLSAFIKEWNAQQTLKSEGV